MAFTLNVYYQRLCCYGVNWSLQKPRFGMGSETFMLQEYFDVKVKIAKVETTDDENRMS